jgi:hypothetical protein
MLRPSGAFEFGEVLPRLVAAYESGRLVPFIGSGLSQPHCRSWPDLIQCLEAEAGAPLAAGAGVKPPADELIRRANEVTRRLRSGRPGEFERALGRSLFHPNPGCDIPSQTVALARIWWPLVLTTNYDNFFVDAFAARFDAASLAVVGRSPEDCQRVLTSLSTAGRTLLWALQGHLAKPRPVLPHHADDHRLSREIVLDHAEYRRVTHREPHFRRAFAEVFRQRTLLFLGAGIAEPYFQELFGEVLEFYGPGSRTHFALLPKGEVDPRFMHSRFQIAVVEYTPGDYPEVPRRIEALAAALHRRTTVPVAWSWGSAAATGAPSARSMVLGHTPALEVVCEALPTIPIPGDCLVVSAGGARRRTEFFLSEGPIRSTAEAWSGRPLPNPVHAGRVDTDGYVGEVADHVYAVRARPLDRDVKDLSEVGPAAGALFEVLKAGNYSRIHMQLLAGGGDGTEMETWSRRPFPARFAFIEVVRSWGAWLRAHPSNSCCLTLHVVDLEVTRELSSGRIDVTEILLCDDLRFWVEIVEADGTLERRLFQKDPRTTIQEVIDELGLSAPYWTFEVSPPTSIQDPLLPPSDLESHVSRALADLTIVPGGTFHLRRR